MRRQTFLLDVSFSFMIVHPMLRVGCFTTVSMELETPSKNKDAIYDQFMNWRTERTISEIVHNFLDIEENHGEKGKLDLQFEEIRMIFNKDTLFQNLFLVVETKFELLEHICQRNKVVDAKAKQFLRRMSTRIEQYSKEPPEQRIIALNVIVLTCIGSNQTQPNHKDIGASTWLYTGSWWFRNSTKYTIL